ncbi:MAG: aminomethyl transferase family protein [Phycisphaerales bacterium]|nr:aminomethyltransferase family protein [Phycisphaerae bacterium]NNF44311.1 aminomethyl transferase family protein [Phycisphaerales bacterium]NNM27240.1 aminomethyl transferase family protein [Phycisphaerales bacterium]
MPIPSPFHPRTSALCTGLRWKDWSGYHAVCSYGTCHEPEYFAFRHAAGLMDVTPLHKYDVSGPDAAAFLARVMVKNILKLRIGQVTYCCWCDEFGKLLDDGTVWRLDEHAYRVTAAEPNLAWLRRNADGFDVTIADTTERIAAVSLQGPNARAILKQVTDADMDALRFFWLTRTTIGGRDAIITRTGYTGDLGYEVWVDNDDALPLWDTLMSAGRPFGIAPTGLDALDVCRVEAGFIMNAVDYYSANHCVIEARKSTPYEAGLGWTVNLDRDPFVGQSALRAEKERGATRRFVGLEIDWDEFEALHARYGLPPELCSEAWRDPRPVYTAGGTQVGQATSGAWSPILKRNLALATVDRPHAAIGQTLRIETTVEFVRHRITATVVEKPFFDPPRKRAVAGDAS